MQKGSGTKSSIPPARKKGEAKLPSRKDARVRNPGFLGTPSGDVPKKMETVPSTSRGVGKLENSGSAETSACALLKHSTSEKVYKPSGPVPLGKIFPSTPGDRGILIPWRFHTATKSTKLRLSEQKSDRRLLVSKIFNDFFSRERRRKLNKFVHDWFKKDDDNCLLLNTLPGHILTNIYHNCKAVRENSISHEELVPFVKILAKRFLPKSLESIYDHSKIIKLSSFFIEKRQCGGGMAALVYHKRFKDIRKNFRDFPTLIRGIINSKTVDLEHEFRDKFDWRKHYAFLPKVKKGKDSSKSSKQGNR